MFVKAIIILSSINFGFGLKVSPDLISFVEETLIKQGAPCISIILPNDNNVQLNTKLPQIRLLYEHLDESWAYTQIMCPFYLMLATEMELKNVFNRTLFVDSVKQNGFYVVMTIDNIINSFLNFEFFNRIANVLIIHKLETNNAYEIMTTRFQDTNSIEHLHWWTGSNFIVQREKYFIKDKFKDLKGKTLIGNKIKKINIG